MHVELAVHISIGHTVEIPLHIYMRYQAMRNIWLQPKINLAKHCLASVPRLGSHQDSAPLSQGHRWRSIHWLAEGEASADGEVLGDVATHKKDKPKNN